MNETRGKYIVIEGPEAVGKSTQVEQLIDMLSEFGVEARSDIREPGGSPIGERIREVLKNGDLARQPLTNLYLFNAARTETLDVIEGELERGNWVVCDRNHWSSYAYQVWGEGLDGQVFETVTEPLKRRLPPDMTVFLMASEEEQRRRLDERGDSDYFQEQAPEFHARVRRGYLEAARRLGTLIDGEGSREEVQERVRTFIRPLIDEVVHVDDTKAAQTLHTQAMRTYGMETT